MDQQIVPFLCGFTTCSSPLRSSNEPYCSHNHLRLGLTATLCLRYWRQVLGRYVATSGITYIDWEKCLKRMRLSIIKFCWGIEVKYNSWALFRHFVFIWATRALIRWGTVIALVALAETVDGAGLLVATQLVGVHTVFALVAATEHIWNNHQCKIKYHHPPSDILGEFWRLRHVNLYCLLTSTLYAKKKN